MRSHIKFIIKKIIIEKSNAHGTYLGTPSTTRIRNSIILQLVE